MVSVSCSKCQSICQQKPDGLCSTCRSNATRNRRVACTKCGRPCNNKNGTQKCFTCVKSESLAVKPAKVTVRPNTVKPKKETVKVKPIK